jgi:tungstate transport system ATP-binding protein
MLARPPSGLITFERVGYAADGRALLCDLSLTVMPGPPTILIGPNGSGKTTLLKLAMGLLPPTTGRIEDGIGDGAKPPVKSIMFQKPVMLRRSVAANVAFALTAAGRDASAGAVTHLLAQVGLASLGERPARKISGGEQQRLSLARALARSPGILLLDEPTASLDPASTKAVEDIVAQVAMRGVKVVMATHDLGQARRLAGDIVFLANGRLVEHAPAARFFQHPANAASRRFLAGELVL